MEAFVQELEMYLLEFNDVLKTDEAEEAESCKIITIETKLVGDILEHLYGKYFGIMYGRHAVKDTKTKDEQLEIEICEAKE